MTCPKVTWLISKIETPNKGDLEFTIIQGFGLYLLIQNVEIFLPVFYTKILKSKKVKTLTLPLQKSCTT